MSTTPPAKEHQEARSGHLQPGTPYYKNGYEWWWHNFVATEPKTGERRAFFIEYFVINPGRGGGRPVFAPRPAYAKIVAGSWGHGSAQLHEHYAISEFSAEKRKMSVRIGQNTIDAHALRGSVSQPYETEWSDAGSMSWDLEVVHGQPWSVGYAAGRFFQKLGAFQMLWHVLGMRTSYSGQVMYNGTVYQVHPKDCCGYCDKNWGSNYTNPWIWLSCNSFVDEQGTTLDTSLDVGGGRPQAFGVGLGMHLLIALHHRGRRLEWNFTKQLVRQRVHVHEAGDEVIWEIASSSWRHRLELEFRCTKADMILLRIEDPRGLRRHNRLWNGGTASGVLRLFEREGVRRWRLVDTLKGSMAACEYGRY